MFINVHIYPCEICIYTVKAEGADNREETIKQQNLAFQRTLLLDQQKVNTNVPVS